MKKDWLKIAKWWDPSKYSKEERIHLVGLVLKISWGIIIVSFLSAIPILIWVEHTPNIMIPMLIGNGSGIISGFLAIFLLKQGKERQASIVLISILLICITFLGCFFDYEHFSELGFLALVAIAGLLLGPVGVLYTGITSIFANVILVLVHLKEYSEPINEITDHVVYILILALMTWVLFLTVDYLNQSLKLSRDSVANIAEQAKQRQVIAELSKKILQSFSLSGLIEDTLTSITEIIKIDGTCFYWVDEKEKVLRVGGKPMGYLDFPGIESFKIPLGQGIIGNIAINGIGEFVNNAYADPRSIYPPEFQPDQNNKDHLIVLPIQSRHITIAVIVAGRNGEFSQPFNEEDFEQIQILVNQAALAIDNIKLLTETLNINANLERLVTEKAGELRKTASLLQSLMDNAPIPIFIKSVKDWKYTQFNKQFQILHGQTAEQIQGHTDYDFYSSEIAGTIQHIDKIVLEERRPIITEINLHDNNENIYTFISNKFPIFDDDNQVLAVGDISLDITERKLSEEKLRIAEERYRLLVEQVPAVVYESEIGENGNWLFVSPKISDILGFTAEEWTTDPSLWAKQLHPDDKGWVLKNEKERAISQKKVSIEYRMLRRDGKIIWIRDNAVSTWNNARKLILWHGILSDITERKEAEEALKKAENQYREIYENLQDIIYETDTLGRIITVSPSVEKESGYTPKELIGKTTRKFYSNPDDYVRLISTLVQKGEINDYEVKLRLKNGQDIYASASIHLIRNENEAVIGTRGVLRNIQTRKQAENAIRRQNEYLTSLHKITLTLINRLDTKELLQTIVEQASQLVDAPYANIDLLESDSRLVTKAYTQNQSFLDGDVVVRGDSGYLSWQAIDSGKPVVISDYATFEHRRDIFKSLQIHATADIPIQIDGKSIGILSVSRTKPNHEFTNEEIYSISLFAQLASVAMDNAQLYLQVQNELSERKLAEENLKRYAENIIIISQMSQQLLTMLNTEEIYTSCHLAIERLMPMDVFLIAIKGDDTNQEIEYPYLWDSEERLPNDKGVLGQGLTSYVINTGKSIFINDWDQSHTEMTGSILFGNLNEDTKSVLAVPLLDNDGNSFGMISVQTYAPNIYTTEHKQLLSTVANIVAKALENTHLVTALTNSEEKYRVIFETVEDVIYETNYHGVFTTISPSSEKFLGQKPEQLVGKHIKEFFVNPDDYEALDATFTMQGFIEDYEVSIKGKEGKTFIASFNAHTIFNAQGYPIGVRGIGRDITTRKEIETRLTQFNAELEKHVQERTLELSELNAFLESILSTALVINSSLNQSEILDNILKHARSLMPCRAMNIMIIEGESAYIARRIGYEGMEQIERDLINFKFPLSWPTFSQMIETGEPVWINNTIEQPNWQNVQSSTWASAYIGIPLKFNNIVFGFLNASHDKPEFFKKRHLEILQVLANHASIAIQKAKLHEGLQTSLENEKATRSKLIHNERLALVGRLLASVSHELNNPLQAIQNALFLMKDESGLSKQGKEDMEIILAETNRLAALIERLRETYRPLKDEDFRPTQINNLINEVYSLTSTYMRHHNIDFSFKADLSLPEISAIPDQLRQVFLNLYLNAVEAMPNGGILTVSTQYVPNDEIQINIVDTGIGIDPELLSQIFSAFVTNKSSGTGLGLTISHDIISQHNGKIQVQSSKGNGTAFTISLPIPNVKVRHYDSNR